MSALRCMVIALLLGAAPVWAGEHVVVRAGEGPAELAARVGAAGQEQAILDHNQLSAGAPLRAGQVLELPAGIGGVERDAAVLFVRGEVTVTPPGGASEPARVGVPLVRDSVVCTGQNSHTTVRLAVAPERRTHDDVTLLPETCITVASATSRAGRRASLIRLQRGSVTVPETELQTGGATALTIETRAGLTSAPAGGFRVHVEAAASRTEALSTPLTVVAQGVERSLQAGQGSRTPDGAAPGEAVDLLVATGLLRPPAGVPLRRPDFAWSAVPEALEYRVELAADPSFREMLRVDLSGLASWSPERLMLPYRVHALWWRVSPVDTLGFVGIPSGTRVLSMPSGVAQ